MKLEPVRISIEGGDLSGLVYNPQGTVRPICVVLAHGFTSGKYSMDGLASYLAAKGFRCLTFDATGHKLGGSGGAMLRIEQAAENLRDAIAWMRLHTEATAIAAVGHSMGAAAAIRAAAWEADASNQDVSMPLGGIACLCMGLNPTEGFSGTLGASMLAQRADYVAGAPAAELLAGLDGMLSSASKLGDLSVLMVAARNDVLLPVARVEALADVIGDHAQIRVIEAMHLDAPDRARGVITNWLESLRV